MEVTFTGPAPDLPSIAGTNVRQTGPSSLHCEVSGSVGPLITALAGQPVWSLISREPSLEEVFLHHHDHRDGAAAN